jgi:hypothetical protein
MLYLDSSISEPLIILVTPHLKAEVSSPMEATRIEAWFVAFTFYSDSVRRKGTLISRRNCILLNN